MSGPDATKNAYISGYCAIGAHENADKRSPSGKSLGRCLFEICQCNCHAMVREMRDFIVRARAETAESTPAAPAPLPGPSQPTAEVEASVSDTHSPSNDPPLGGPQRVAMTPLPPVTRGRAPEKLLAVQSPVGLRHDSGRRIKGSLDVEVRTVCERWLKGEIPGDDAGHLTPKYIAEMLNASSGAVSACWARWEKKSTCELGKKPARFVRFKEAES